MLDKPTVLTTPGRSEETSLDVLISDIYGGHFGSAKRGQMHRLFQTGQHLFGQTSFLRSSEKKREWRFYGACCWMLHARENKDIALETNQMQQSYIFNIF